MNTLFNFGKKSSTKPPTISAPILNYPHDDLASKSNYCYDAEKYSNPSQWSKAKHTLPPRPTTPPQRRLPLYVYITSTLLSLAAIILFSIVIPKWNKNFIHLQSPIKSDWPDELILIPLVLSHVSSIYLIIIWFTRRRHKNSLNSPDPFNLITLSSTLLFALIPTIIIVSINSLAHAFSSNSASSDTHGLTSGESNQTCTLSNIYTRPCLPILYEIGDLQIGAIVLSSIVGITWLAILIIAARDLLRRRAAAKREQRERRRRKHAKRRGHERGTSHRHRHRRTRKREEGQSKEVYGDHTNGLSRHQPSPAARKIPVLLDSNAVYHAHHKVRPNVTMQDWMANRY